jgi:prepilin-type N-terminal cleavage/methylation domain-containing protein
MSRRKNLKQSYKDDAGFTLVELLVVISIIGILTSVVLVSVSTANKRGNDAAVQSDLSEIRAQAQMYYNNYSGYVATPPLGSAGTCATAGTVFADTKVKQQIDAAEKANGGRTVVCNVSIDGADYAVSSELSTAGTYYCVDSNGIGVRSTTALGLLTSCP